MIAITVYVHGCRNELDLEGLEEGSPLEMCYLLCECCFVPYLGLARTVLLCDGHHQHAVDMVAVAKLDLWGGGLEEGSLLGMCCLLGELPNTFFAFTALKVFMLSYVYCRQAAGAWPGLVQSLGIHNMSHMYCCCMSLYCRQAAGARAGAGRQRQGVQGQGQEGLHHQVR
jgi:hypothetical protein